MKFFFLCFIIGMFVFVSFSQMTLEVSDSAPRENEGLIEEMDDLELQDKDVLERR